MAYQLDVDSQQVLTQLYIKSDGEIQPLGVNMKLREATIELLPGKREYKTKIPGRHGELFFASEYDVRLMELPVFLAADMAAAETQKRSIVANLHKLTGSYPLAIEWAEDRIYNVQLAEPLKMKQLPTWLEFAIRLKMLDPFAYFPIEKKLIGAGNIVNGGDIEVPLRIEIPGDVTNPEATIDGTTYRYNGTIAAGETLVVDSAAKTAKIGSTNELASWAGGFSEAAVGTTTVTVTTGAWNIFWMPRYLI